MAASDEIAQAWVKVRSNLRSFAGERLFNTWLRPAVLIPDDGESDTIRLGLPSDFVGNWVRSHYAERLTLEFRALLPWVRAVAVETLPEAAALPLRGELPEPMVAAPAATPAAPSSPAVRPVLDARFTFDRFVVGQSNRVAFNAARALAEPGPPRFSPLFLHSHTGQGKTHLMHAIGHAFLEQQPEASVIYMSAERFMVEFVQALRARDTFAFKARLRSTDLLMIDDIQFIGGKDSTQEEFFHTVNELTAAGRRLVISADCCPQNLDKVEARIVSRLTAGLAADIRKAEPELRRAILEAKLADLPLVVPTEVLDLLASRITDNIRVLEGALNRLVAYAQLSGEPITAGYAETVLADFLRGARRRVTIDEIQRAVSTHFEVKQLDLVSARRAAAIARPRQIAMYLAKRLTTRSLPEIGRKFGGRDHSTVIHAVRRIEELRGKDQEIDGAVRKLLRQLEE